MFKKICLVTVIALLLFTVPVCAVVEMNEEGDSYQFGSALHTVDAPTAYTAKEILTAADFGAEKFVSLDDLCTDDAGNIYLADSEGGTIYKLSADRVTRLAVSNFKIGEETVAFGQPTGIFVDTKGEVYVADRTAAYIYVFDTDFNFKRRISPPAKEEFFSEQAYEPIKVCVDSGGRIYVISANQTQGILQFSPEGKFIGFLGATRVQPTAAELLARMFATKEQRNSLLRLIPTEYNNMDVDGDNFIYATISALTESSLYGDARNNTANATPIRRLNPKGEDVLLRQGAYPPMGDVNFLLTYQAGKQANSEETRGASRMVDTACRINGVYTLLDNRQGRMFTYNRSGELLFVSGGPGDKRDELLAPTAIDYFGNYLIVADQGAASVKIFEPTAYANQVITAIDYHEQGDYESEAKIWEEVKREYIGSELAYLGLGKAEFTLKNYEAAMENFKLADNKEYYSKAYKAYRKEWGYQNIGWLLGGAALACVAIVILVRATHKKIALCMENPYTLPRRVWYAKDLIFHPFKNFWDLKVHNIGTVASATVILVLTVLLKLLETATKPYLLQSDDGNRNILLQGFFGIVLLVGLFVVANWCFTSLMDGKGKFRDIYIYACYSLFPMVLITPIQILISNFISQDEMVLYTFLSTLSIVLVLFLLFIGTLVIHDYGFGKTVVMLILTAIGMMILVFIAMLCITLLQQILLYIRNIISELQLR